jgi:hypothetical protein
MRRSESRPSVAEHVQAEVNARRQRGPAHHGGVERAAEVLDEGVEAGLGE